MARKHCHINELEPPFSSLLPEFGAGRQARLAFPDLRAATPDPLHHITTALRDAFRAYRRSGPGPAVEADPDGGFLGHSGNSNHRGATATSLAQAGRLAATVAILSRVGLRDATLTRGSPR